MEITENLKGKIIVSCQAAPDEPLYQEDCMLGMMASVVSGGAGGLRVAGARDVRNAKRFGVPVIGLTKPDKLPENWRETVYITPGIKDVNLLIEAGADIIAFDGTSREHDNCTVDEIIKTIQNAGLYAMADISVFEEGLRCAEAGADFISTTLSGYTLESGEAGDEPDFDLLEKLVKKVDKPIILEGRVWNLKEVKRAFTIGAHAVVIGSAITRPQLITKRFTEGIGA